MPMLENLTFDEITVGQAVVKLSGPTVSVNSGALEVT